MKLRHTTLLIALALILTACNFTLAADVTPPPNYVAPTPMPTLGALYPASAPNVHNGAQIYVEKCAACHGDAGLGDGEQGKQLPVTVAAIGLADVAQKAAPSAWYTEVTQGNMERFMPPFASLSDQDRWDVVSYAFFLHMTPDQIAQGKALFESSCADCAKYFSNQEMMSALSESDLIQLMKNGAGGIPAFGKNFSDEEAAAVAVYLRSLTFSLPAMSVAATPAAQATTAPVSGTPAVEATATVDSGTPAADVTPVDGTPAAAGTPLALVGNVSGSVDNQTGADLPSDVKVILHGYDHGGDPNAGPQEVLTLDGNLKADGTYVFENVDMTENRIYVAEIIVGDVSYNTGFVVVKAGMTEVTIPVTTLYGVTSELTDLSVDNVVVHFDFTDPAKINVFLVYSMYNKGNKTIFVKLENNNQDIPFIKAPANAEGLGFQTTQDSAQFVGTKDQSGFYMSPSEKAYGLVAFASVAKSKKTEFSQQFVLPVGAVKLFVPEGVTLSGKQLADDGVTPLQDSSGKTVNFHSYSASALKAGDTLAFTISGEPSTSTAVNPDITQNKNLLIGVGAFGVVLILVGVWLFIRDRNKPQDEETAEDEDEFEDSESVMDAIIALDDLHRAGKISDEAYQQRREELKSQLKKN